MARGDKNKAFAHLMKSNIWPQPESQKRSKGSCNLAGSIYGKAGRSAEALAFPRVQKTLSAKKPYGSSVNRTDLASLSAQTLPHRLLTPTTLFTSFTALVARVGNGCAGSHSRALQVDGLGAVARIVVDANRAEEYAHVCWIEGHNDGA